MSRLLILLIIGVGLFWWVSSRLRSRAAAKRRPTPPAQAQDAVRDMVACAHCGVHLPRDEAVADGARLFCGDGHRRLGPRAE